MKSTIYKEEEIYRKEDYQALQERIKEIEEVINTSPDDKQLISFLKRLKGKKKSYSLYDEKIEIETDILDFYLPYILNCEYHNDLKDEYYLKYLKEFDVKDSIEFINVVRDKFVDFIKRCRRYYDKRRLSERSLSTVKRP